MYLDVILMHMKKTVFAVMASLVVLWSGFANAAVSPFYMFKLNQFKAWSCLTYVGNPLHVDVTYTNCSCFVWGNAVFPSIFESHPDITVTNPNQC